MKTGSCLLAFSVFAGLTSAATAEILGVREAEQTTITCAASIRPHGLLWASGKQIAPASWGRTAGDKLEFELTTDSFQGNVKLGIRYAYFAAWHKRDVKNPAPRELQLVIDGTTTLPVAVPDTDGWNHFRVAEVALPPLQPGRHQFALISTADFSCTNIDAFVFFREPVPLERNGILRDTRLVAPEKGIVLCASDLAILTEPAEHTHAMLQGLYELLLADFGMEEPVRFCFHLTDKTRWWNTEAPVVQNKFGIYVLANGQPYDRAEWCWALARYLALGSGVPEWFADSSSRVTGWVDWLPSLPGNVSDAETENTATAMASVQEFLDSDHLECARVETVHLAVRVQYGQDVFRRFWELIAQKSQEAGSSVKLDKHQTVAILSEAAGEDVLPLYERWSGFRDEGPVDPLVLVFQAPE